MRVSPKVMMTVFAAAEIHARRTSSSGEWVVTLGDDGHSAAMALLGGARSFLVVPRPGGATITALGGASTSLSVASFQWDWEAPLVTIDCGEGSKVLQYLGPSQTGYCGYRFNTSGATLQAAVLSSKEHKSVHSPRIASITGSYPAT